MKILVVDDDISVRLYLENILKKANHDVLICDNGLDAWNIIKTQEINLLVTDWMMPGLSGVELCNKIRNELISSHYIYIILLTGKTERDDCTEGYAAGADDFISKPVATKELHVRIKAAQRVLKLEQQLVQQNQKLELANKEISYNYQHIKQDLEAAAKLQQALLPKSSNTFLPVNIAWDFRPADDLAGDIFGFYIISLYFYGNVLRQI